MKMAKIKIIDIDKVIEDRKNAYDTDYEGQVSKDRVFIKKQLAEIDNIYSELTESADNKILFLMVTILQRVQNWNEADRAKFDEEFSMKKDWNLHGYGNTDTKLIFDSNGIHVRSK